MKLKTQWKIAIAVCAMVIVVAGVSQFRHARRVAVLERYGRVEYDDADAAPTWLPERLRYSIPVTRNALVWYDARSGDFLSSAAVCELADLRYLRIRGQVTSAAALGDRLRGASQLYSIDVNAVGMTTADLQQLTAIPQLFSLTLRHARLDGVLGLSRLTKLHELVLYDCDLTPAGAADLSRCQQVRDLVLFDVAIRGGDLAFLRRLAALRRLGLVNCFWDTHNCNLMLPPSLSCFSARKSPLKDGDLAAFGGLPRLETIDLSETCVTGSGLAQLADCPALRNLGLRWMPLSSLAGLADVESLRCLSLYKSRPTPAAMVDLSSLRQLFALDLEGVPLTDDDTGHLMQLRGIGYLNLYPAKFSEDVVLRLFDAFPKRQLSVYTYGLSPEVRQRLRSLEARHVPDGLDSLPDGDWPIRYP